MSRIKTLEGWVEKATEVHNGKYDYSKVVYQRASGKSTIVCPEHGEFVQSLSNHLQGQGCPKCGKVAISTKLSQHRRSSTEKFLKKATEIHGERYDYSQVNYQHSCKNVKIVCPIHGGFFQTPYTHLKGRGCRKCSDEFKRYDNEKFIQKAKEKHGNKYNYDSVVYNNCFTKVVITCPIHGNFLQSPANHLFGYGCPECGRKSKTLSKDTFTKKALQIHGSKYNYDNVKYINGYTPVEIICPIHGVFSQSPSEHLRGRGCRMCSGMESPPEIYLRNKLVNMGYTIYHNIKDGRYPFKVDIYLKEKDLFIELNLFWTHGGHWFNKNCSADLEMVSNWKAKNTLFYDNAVKNWTISDVNKRSFAKKNDLNYIVLWTLEDIDLWLSLGCPNGHDWKHEYSWLPNRQIKDNFLML